ncbi:uncharacterized protein [Dysidea avara]|uniref:uncharacterized protein n=1 Tax=Dysidea avara TaxID=196820 RepID=UPI003321BFEC
MCTIVEKAGNDDLEKLIKEGNEHGVGELMKEIWFTDKKRQTQQFANDQAANATGSRGNRWSLVTIRMALAVYLRSPAVYETQKSFKILQLPCQSTLKAYTEAFMRDHGARSDCIMNLVTHYVAF